MATSHPGVAAGVSPLMTPSHGDGDASDGGGGMAMPNAATATSTREPKSSPPASPPSARRSPAVEHAGQQPVHGGGRFGDDGVGRLLGRVRGLAQRVVQGRAGGIGGVLDGLAQRVANGVHEAALVALFDLGGRGRLAVFGV
ncbi:MAG: hypothetical protein BRC32_05375 [Actinobacteria bacterium QS_8_72_14]|nr:MAG: hypothetical protein BRC32_05375 [Actinobacteria bacterium QS_8_72_14]